MNIVVFGIEVFLNKILKEVNANLIEKFLLRRKFKKISDFVKSFDNTDIDTYTFQEFLNREEIKNFIFHYVFSTKPILISEEDFIINIATSANDFINEKKLLQGLPKIDVQDMLIVYFQELLKELYKLRDTELSSTQQSIVATFQSSLIISNQDLKEYIDNKFEELKNHSLAKYLTESKLKELLNKSIKSLGPRYKENANVETHSNLIFKTLIFDEQISETLTKKKQSIINGTAEITQTLLNMDYKGVLDSTISECFPIIESLDFYNKTSYLAEQIEPFIKSVNTIGSELVNTKYFLYTIQDKDSLQRQSIKLVNNLLKTIDDIIQYIENMKINLINSPYLIIKGDGGIGKSHLLADTAQNLQAQGHIVFLFLGQHFSTNEHPFKQIFDFLEYSGTSDNFLSELNNRANKNNKKAIIFIDALNEGQGKYFWKTYFSDFLSKISLYPNISLVVSNRTNFMRSIFPEELENDYPVTIYEHKGFTDLSLSELTPFFNFYNISSIIVPQLQSECRNPLFLHLYCEVSTSDETVFQGWSITEVLNKYIDKINYKLSRDARFSYLDKINVVDKCLNQIALKMLSNGSSFLHIEEAFDVIEEIAKKYMSNYHDFLNGLIEENLLSWSKNYKKQDIIYFSYERFGDIYIANAILESYEESELYLDLSNVDRYYHGGIYEALSIILPERFNKEIFEVLKEEEVNYEVVESFVRGLSWRNSINISNKVIPLLEQCIESDENIRSLIYDRLIQFSYLEHNILNSNYLHKHLIKMSLSERDSKWTIYINQRPVIIERVLELVSIVHQDTRQLNKKILSLLVINTTWLLTSSNRILRDKATHILVKLFKDNMEFVLPTLKMFEKINDPYVYERLFAAVYGATLRTKQAGYLKEIGDYIFTEIFEKVEIYPHVLLRDYARGILLFTLNREEFSGRDFTKCNPPYKSKWYDKTPSLDEIDEISRIYSVENYQTSSYSVQAIISSMTTEYGRGTSGYGDFGRYTFQSALSAWENQFDVQDLSNIATKRVFDMGYDVSTHGEYDLMTGKYSDRFSNTTERIGKKYQWIAFHELMARLIDNYPIFIEEKIYSSGYQDYLEKKHLEFIGFINKELDDSGQEEDKEEICTPELNSDDYVVEVKRVLLPYNGPWEPFVRDIDSSLLMNKKVERDKLLLDYSLPENSSLQWVLNDNELDKMGDVFKLNIESNQFISLAHLYINKRETSPDYKTRDELCIKTKAVFVKREDVDEYIESKTQSGGGNGVSWKQSHTTFAFEYFWHPSYIDYEESYSDEQNVKKIDAVWDFLWERHIDYNTDSNTSISYLIPSASLVQFFKLSQETEGFWTDSNGDIIAYDASLMGYESCLLFNQEKLEEYLNAHDYCMLWDVYLEKVSDKNYHEWWLLYWEDNFELKYEVLDEAKGEYS